VHEGCLRSLPLHTVALRYPSPVQTGQAGEAVKSRSIKRDIVKVYPCKFSIVRLPDALINQFYNKFFWVAGFSSFKQHRCVTHLYYHPFMQLAY
jgi:hypothetical protein